MHPASPGPRGDSRLTGRGWARGAFAEISRRTALLLLVGLGLAAGSSAPASASIYWTSGSSIGRADDQGHHVRPALIGSLALPCGVAVTRRSIFWAGGFSGSGAIGRARIDGHHVDTRFIRGADLPCDPAVGGGHIYWTNNGGTIGRADLDGSHATQSFLSVGSNQPGPLAVAGHYLFFVRTPAALPGGGNLIGGGEIDRLDLSAPQAGWKQLAVTTPPMSAIAVSGSDVYFGYGNLIGRVGTDGAGLHRALVRLRPGVGISALAATARHLYWGEKSGRFTIARSDLQGKHIDHRFVTGIDAVTGIGLG